MIYKKAKSLDKFKQKTSLSGEVLVIDGSHYTVEDLHNLPGELNIRQFSEKVNNDFYVFGGIHSSANPFSNWYSCKIQHEGHTFKSVEQAYQFSKAMSSVQPSSDIPLTRERLRELGQRSPVLTILTGIRISILL